MWLIPEECEEFVFFYPSDPLRDSRTPGLQESFKFWVVFRILLQAVLLTKVANPVWNWGEGWRGGGEFLWLCFLLGLDKCFDRAGFSVSIV